MFIHLFICTQRSANDTSELRQGIIYIYIYIYIYLDFIGPYWNIFSYYYTIFKLILF